MAFTSATLKAPGTCVERADADAQTSVSGAQSQWPLAPAPAPAGWTTWKLLADQARRQPLRNRSPRSRGGGGAQAQLGVAAESRPVSEDRRGRGGGSSWVRSVGRRPRGSAGPRTALCYLGSSPAGRPHLPAQSPAPAGSILVPAQPLILHPHLRWVGGRRVPGSQAAAGSPSV